MADILLTQPTVASSLESLTHFFQAQATNWPLYLQFCVIVAGFYFFAKITSILGRMVLRKSAMHQSVIDLILDSYRLVLIIVGIIFGLSQLGINVTAGIAGLGIAGIAVGFAAKDTLANIISGITLFWDKPFSVGDWIRMRDYEGQVVQITMRSTRIRTRKNEYIIAPNQEIANQTLVNLSKQGEIRIEIPFMVGYKENIDVVRRTLAALHVGDTRLSSVRDNPSEIVIEGPGDSGVKCLYRIWISDYANQQRVFMEYNEKIIKGLRAAKIQIPYPHLELLHHENKQ